MMKYVLTLGQDSVIAVMKMIDENDLIIILKIVISKTVLVGEFSLSPLFVILSLFLTSDY